MARKAAPPDDSVSAAEDARYQIGEVAERTGVTQRTLRFYEEKGLLQPSDRMQGGFRLYSDQDVTRIERIKNLQELLGLTLAEIKEMVDAEGILQEMRATFRSDLTPAERRERLTKVHSALQLQREIIDRKIEQLREMKGVLDERFEVVERRSREVDEQLAAEPPTRHKRG